MYHTNRGRSAKASKLERYIPHPARTKRKPRYIGLRVKRYMPEVTMAVVVSGLSGLTVVFAWRNAKTPAKTIANPKLQKIRANFECHGSARVNAE